MLRRFSRLSVGMDSLPHIDAVLLTHDHYDHLDKRTVKALADKAGRFIVSSGAERHLRKWGIPNDRIKRSYKKIYSNAWSVRQSAGAFFLWVEKQEDL